jgi:hypothetical protein
MKKNKVLVFAWSISDVIFYSSILVDSEVDYVCGRMSAFFYAKSIRKNAYPFYQRFSLRKTKPDAVIGHWRNTYDYRFYRGYDIWNSVDIRKLRKKAKEIISSNHYDLLVLPGEFRLREQIFIDVKTSVIRTIFWEVGPIGFVYFSAFGTNANAKLHLVYRHKTLPTLLKKFQIMGTKKHVVVNKNFISILKFIEYFYLFVCIFILGSREFMDFFPRKNIVSVRRKKQSLKSFRKHDGYIIFYGQVENDVNCTHFSLNIDKFKQKMLSWKHQYPNHQVILKPHPRETSNRYNSVVIDIFGEDLDYYRGEHSKLDDASDNVHHVTVNSNIIAELLMNGSSVVVLGETMYDGLVGIRKDLSEEIIHRKIIVDDITDFMNSNFLPYNLRQKVWVRYDGMTKLLREIANA